MNVKEILYVITTKGKECISTEFWEFLKKQEEFFDARSDINEQHIKFGDEYTSDEEYEEEEKTYQSSFKTLQEKYLKESLELYHKIDKYKEKGIASILIWEMDEFKDAFLNVENKTGQSYMITQYLKSHFRLSLSEITEFSDDEIVSMVNLRRINL